jgi:hypothetical protein
VEKKPRHYPQGFCSISKHLLKDASKNCFGEMNSMQIERSKDKLA